MPNETLPPDIAQMLATYQASSNGENGIPTALYQYAQAHPELLIDRSGNNLKPADPMFNFYNPNPGQTQGSDWFAMDDRNNAMLKGTGEGSQLFQQAAGLTPLPGSSGLIPAGAPGTLGQVPGSSPNPGFTVGTGAPMPTNGLTGLPSPTATPKTSGVPLLPSTPSVPTGTGTTPAPTAPTVNTGVPTLDLFNQLLQLALQTQNTPGQGLSPAAMAALRTQALEDVPAQFKRAQSDLMTRLLRSGGANLPMGGDFLRNYAPLQAAELGLRADLLRQATMADEQERIRSGEANRAFGLQAIQAAAGIAGQRGNYELGQQQFSSQWNIANLDADTRVKLAQMGITSNEQMAAMDADLRRELAQIGVDSNMALAQLDRDTRMDLLEMQMRGDKTGLKIAASVFSSALANPSLIKDGVKWIKNTLGIGSAAAGAAGAGTAGGAAGTIGGSTAAGGTGFGTQLAAFATNPFTIGIAAAAAAGFMLYKKFGTDHLRANDLVQNFENPWTKQFLVPMHDEFFKAAGQGQMTAQQAQAARAEFVSGWEEYVRQIRAWAAGDGSKTDVMNQSINNLWPLIQQSVADMDRVIQSGNFDYAIRGQAA